MTNEEIDALLANSEKSIRLELLTTPLAGWMVSLGTVISGFFFPLWQSLFFLVPLLFISLIISVNHRAKWLEFKARRAEGIWEHLRTSVFSYRHNALTAGLTKTIAHLYQSDRRGELLPLSQAIRLVETHHKQQQRLEVVNARLATLRSIGLQLREKTELLRSLGESHHDAETHLQAMKNDETSLSTMRDQIMASCHRLEMILLEVQKTGQMRQLHREISALTCEETRSQTSRSTAEQHETLLGIEAQITREIETFLRLERDTDAHLRQI